MEEQQNKKMFSFYLLVNWTDGTVMVRQTDRGAFKNLRLIPIKVNLTLTLPSVPVLEANIDVPEEKVAELMMAAITNKENFG